MPKLNRRHSNETFCYTISQVLLSFLKQMFVELLNLNLYLSLLLKTVITYYTSTIFLRRSFEQSRITYLRWSFKNTMNFRIKNAAFKDLSSPSVFNVLKQIKHPLHYSHAKKTSYVQHKCFMPMKGIAISSQACT